MKAEDALAFAFGAVRGYRTRSLLMMLAMAIGVAAVVVLTALGDGARNYVTGQFASLGTNLLIVLPGRSETTGGGLPMGMAATPRDLTLDDALALRRSRLVRRVAP
ncbi:MAG: ABC transporter permease, partial [Gammaproteobacteria bacterium]